MLSLDGKIDVRCSIEKAWDLFCRFGDVAALIPTVQEVQIQGDIVHATMETKLGALPISSRVTLEVTERIPLKRLKAEGWSYLGETLSEQVKKLDGVDKGSAGRLDMQLDLLPSEKEGFITLVYGGEVEAKGRLKRIYKTILKTKAPGMIEEFAHNIREALEGDEQPVTEAEAAVSPVDGPAQPVAVDTTANVGRVEPASDSVWLEAVARLAKQLPLVEKLQQLIVEFWRYALRRVALWGST